MPKDKTVKQALLGEGNGQLPKDRVPQQCVFCQIVKQKTDSLIVFQDEISTAFLDKRPLFLGHCLLVPNEHYATLSELPSRLIGPYFTNAKLLAAAIEKALQADGSFLAINNKISQSVPHLHVHIVPRRSGDGLRGFFYPRQSYSSPEEAVKVQQGIRSAISELQTA
jgi:histidine triad (HIT) family protein